MLNSCLVSSYLHGFSMFESGDLVSCSAIEQPQSSRALDLAWVLRYAAVNDRQDGV